MAGGANEKDNGLPKEELQRRAQMAKQLSSAFGDIVTMLMRSQSERTRTLADLEWMVVPAMQTGQFAVAEAQQKETGMVTPMGVVLWAWVSEAVDKRLSAQLDKPMKLDPGEWKSGEIPWIVAAFGEPTVVNQLFQQLSKSVFTETPAKLRARDKDGKPFVGRLEFKTPTPSN
jgi:cytolysin-activating lysine-acyltransferase